MNNLIKYLGVVAIALLFTACSKNDDITKPTDKLTKVGEDYAIGAGVKVEVWSAKSLKSGYNKIYLLTLDSITNQQKNVNLNIKPMMTMLMDGGMKMQHSAPFEDADRTATKDNLVPAAVIFTMPSSDSGFWNLEVLVNSGNKAVIPIVVKAAEPANTLSLTSLGDNQKYVVALVPSADYKIGANDFELVISKRIDGMTYVPVNGFTIEMTPEMPDMGHGSPNNVNPVFIKNGHYKGKVNFTMTGYWKVDLKIKDQNGVLISNDTSFKIIF